MKLNSNFALLYNQKIKPKQYNNKNIIHQNNFQTDLKNQSEIRNINFHNLSSKFNINFTSLKTEEKTYAQMLDEFSVNFERKLKEIFEVEDEFLNGVSCAIKSSKDVEEIAQVFWFNKISKIEPTTGVSLNNALRYLASCGCLELHWGRYSMGKTAFVFDRMSIDYLRKLKETNPLEIDYYSEMFKEGELKPYFINVSEDEKNKLLEEANKILNYPLSGVKVINSRKTGNNVSHLNQYPNKEQIKNLVDKFIESKSIPQNKKKDFLKALSKYLCDNSLYLPYPVLFRELKKMHGQITQDVIKKGKSPEEIHYIYPVTNKSYDLINYLYACINNIDSNSFYSFNEAEKLPCDYENKRTFAVLDDFSLSGNSVCEYILEDFCDEFYRNKLGNELIIAPVVYTKSAQQTIEKAINTLHEIYHELKIELFKNIKYSTIEDLKHKNENEKNGLTGKEIDCLLENLNSGYGKQYSSVFVPYMIPDNSSDISEELGHYFLN